MAGSGCSNMRTRSQPLALFRHITWLPRAHAMTQPAKRIPRWLTIDVLVIVISLAIIGIGIGIGIAP